MSNTLSNSRSVQATVLKSTPVMPKSNSGLAETATPGSMLSESFAYAIETLLPASATLFVFWPSVVGEQVGVVEITALLVFLRF